MSYIEKKYNLKIREIFQTLSNLDISLYDQLNKKSVKNVTEIAKLCAEFNHNINVILKKYYPEITEMNDKLEIKSILKFYFDLIFKLTDLVRNVENFQSIDQEYYDRLMEFINEKEILIGGKYKDICAQELAVFYDKNSRDKLERVLIEKIERNSRQYFTFGSLEEEIKKRAMMTGASSVVISVADKLSKEELENAQSIIIFDVSEAQDFTALTKIGHEIKNFLESKNFSCYVKNDTLITDAKLLPD
ncbi:MAG: hypothetical protein ACW986_02925 [Promethearchaeota archaeon]|jgi:endonuclease III-like uncharacterized protein